jgi:hypothetical protein
VPNRGSRDIAMIITKTAIELIMINNKNASVAKIYQVHNGCNVVMNRNAEDQIGIIYNVQVYNRKIC